MEFNNPVNVFDSSQNFNEKLKEFGFVKNFQADEVILGEHAYIKSIPIVVKGVIRVMRSDDDYKEILLYYIRAGESCIMSFLGGIHHDTSKVKAIAEEETEVLFIPVEKIPLLIKDYPEWLDYIFRLYHKRFEELLELVNALTFKKMDERILHFLYSKKELHGESSLKITHEQIALEMGTARVVVSRILKQMEEEGLLILGRNKITLL